MNDFSSPYLYRIMPLRHAVDLFETRELFFASPTTWEDPYERILQHRGTPWTFAQCWGKRAVSDAMWRIYSGDRMAVRVRTTRERLKGLVTHAKASFHCHFRVDDVHYDSTRNANQKLDQLAKALKTKSESALEALFLKRDAFDFESEVRAVIHVTRPTGSEMKGGQLRLRVDPHALIDSIYFDPRAEETFVRVASHYLRTALHFEGPIGRSALYRTAESLVIPDEPDPPLQTTDAGGD